MDVVVSIDEDSTTYIPLSTKLNYLDQVKKSDVNVVISSRERMFQNIIYQM